MFGSCYLCQNEESGGAALEKPEKPGFTIDLTKREKNIQMTRRAILIFP